MKLKTTKERKALSMLRRLDATQREDLLGQMERQVLANRITARISGMRRIRTVGNRRIEKAFGTAPQWRLKKGKPSTGTEGAGS